MTKRTCTIDGCDRTHWAKTMCSLHYKRSRAGSPLDAPIRVLASPYAGTQCSVEDCATTPIASGMCDTHYRRWKKCGNPLYSAYNREHQALPLNEAFRALCGEMTATGCIQWQGTRNSQGYGQVVRDGVKVSAHRYAYEQAHGPIPEGHVIRHTCDNKPCVEPGHLLTGTGRDNAMDAVERFRYRHGTAHHAAKMDPDSVRDLRRLRRHGLTYQQLAARFDLSLSQARAIARREAWRHVA